jgi:hypothetical protein
MLPNKVLILVPRLVIAAMAATEISAAIKPYSIAVAPLSSQIKLFTVFMGKLLHTFSTHELLISARLSIVRAIP